MERFSKRSLLLMVIESSLVGGMCVFQHSCENYVRYLPPTQPKIEFRMPTYPEPNYEELKEKREIII